MSRRNHSVITSVARAAIGAALGGCLLAQVPHPLTVPPQPEQPINAAPGSTVPIFSITVVDRSIAAINYLHRGPQTTVDFQATPLLPGAYGRAKVESERGVIRVNAEIKDLAPPSSFGPEYLTYVLWAISPDGRPVNLGELTLDHYGKGSNAKISATSDIQTFGMIVTAEPYYAVTTPSDAVVLENVVRPDTRGVVESISAKYELLPRGLYSQQGRAPGFVPINVGKHDPFELYEAENAIQLARVAGAEKYASDSFGKAQASLQQAERYQDQKRGQMPVITMAREAVVRAEDARVIAIRAEKAEHDAQERQAALDRENAAKAEAQAQQLRAEKEARDRADADRARMAAEVAKADALTAAQVADRERQRAEQAKAEADAAKAAAIAEQQKLAQEADQAKLAAASADAARAQALAANQQLADQAAAANAGRLQAQADLEKAEQDRAQLRERLLEQFNQVLKTTETARGLIVNMSDVLFDTARYTLKPGAREKLAKVAGIILAHPGLRIEVEGFTDSVGGDEYNLTLSENRADAVRAYLVEQGIAHDAITSKGYGKADPVADNSTAAGRQMNRRVQLVVSGDILGTSVSTTRTTTTTIPAPDHDRR